MQPASAKCKACAILSDPFILSHKNFGVRIDHLLVTVPLRYRVVWAEIDREARKRKPLPSDHAPLVIDIDSPDHPFDPGWTSIRELRPASRSSDEPQGWARL